MSLKTNYMGLELNSPVIAASSSFTNSADKLVQLEQCGAGAVVLKSVFEEQISGEVDFLEKYNDYPEAADYLKGYIESDYLKGHLDLVREAKQRINIPVIASINCQSAGRWIDYASRLEAAGADALELNISILPTDADNDASRIENRYLDIVESVTGALKIPVAVKLGVRFTNIINMARRIADRKAKGIVLFNRFFEPDIDIDNLTLIGSEVLSSPVELRNNLRSVGLCSAQVPVLDISVSTGVHSGADAVKCLLAGARTVQLCSVLYKEGLPAIGAVNTFIAQWMERHTVNSIDDISGKLDYDSEGDREFYQRLQYMKFFPKG